MSSSDVMIAVVAVLIFGRWATELWLATLNRCHVLRHAQAIPEPLRGVIDSKTYQKSVDYTLARNGVERFEITFSTLLLMAVLGSGVLPRGFEFFRLQFGDSAWAQAGFVLAVSAALALLHLPLEWHAQFHVERRFGFNTTTPRLWWVDRAKGFALLVVLGYPVLVLVLKLVEWTGEQWWFWAWTAVFGFQLLMAVLAPALILSLFNKFKPLPEGELRTRLLGVAERTGFRTRDIQVMDGSRRSLHSNAFFAGFGRFRKIVLYDTLIEQLGAPELEAVLAHEIGHHKRRHLPKLLAANAIGFLAGFWILGQLAAQESFYRAFGFTNEAIGPALLLFGLLAGAGGFVLTPLANFWSRRYEYQADAYAARTIKDRHPLILALRKLSTSNLSNLTPHPVYTAFYYSHPTLLERERALAGEPV